ncbi:hypothetical protein A3Q56_07962 [Intoshia linei]|uniref:Uncharacterized protein n=1 Tax=Intoshia linei TaxID=1819745 RepID=A0A177AQQ0_9BILA|nr:hypothetical protein A3Q56_07962 [Intoshia linei]
MKQFRSEKYRKNKNKDGNANGPTINMEMCSLRLCKCQKRPKRFSTINFIWKDLSNINKTWLLNNYGLDKDTKRCCFSCFVGINHYLNNNKCTDPEPKEKETNVIENEIVKVHKRRKRRNRKMKHKVPSKTLKTTKSENLCVNDKVKELNISESSIYSNEKCFDKLESNNNDISIKEEKNKKSSNYSGVEENSIAALSSNSIEDVSKCEFECKQSKSDTDSGGISKNFKNKTNTFKNILLDHYEPISDQE